ncbi:MAG: RsmB/NOP family class I SAM-dependent RNA methyltransferase [Maricaulaceae bacterium]
MIKKHTDEDKDHRTTSRGRSSALHERTPRDSREQKRPLANGVQSRLIIARAIQTVWGQGITIEDALEQQEHYNSLSDRDRAFARNVIAMTFRHWGQVNHVLKQYLKKEPPAFIMAVMRSAATQSLFLKTPAHAVVGESVAALKAVKSAKGFAGMANAVLRRLTETGQQHLGDVPPHVNVPKWILRHWEKDYGRMEARRIARQIMDIPPLDITLKPEKNMEETAKSLEATPLIGTSVRRPHAGHITQLEGFDSGDWWVQDVATSLPVQILEDITGGLKDKIVFDLCAAPGGKTLQLASYGAKVTAIDKSSGRLNRLRENLTRCRLNANIMAADVLELPEDLGLADHIILDVPCTATGTFRRHPEVLYNRKPKDQAALMRLQLKMLDAASNTLKKDGYLVYCTCSLQKEEGEGQIDKFLQKRTDFRLNRILTKVCLSLDTDMIGDGVLRTQPNFWKDLGGMDGFFAAILQKTD